jgi:hypothetical protein
MGMVLPVMGVVTAGVPPIIPACATGMNWQGHTKAVARTAPIRAGLIERDDPNNGRDIKRYSS